jgi:hypothetical protein
VSLTIQGPGPVKTEGNGTGNLLAYLARRDVGVAFPPRFQLKLFLVMIANKAMLGPTPMSNLNNRNNRNALGFVLVAGGLEYDEFIELGMILCAMIAARPLVSILFIISVGGLLILWPLLKDTSPWTGRK